MSFVGRELNGKSNNLKNVHWGSANENLIRLAGHAYGDNVSEPSGACTVQQKAANKCPYPNELSGIGSNRPSPRFISNELMAQVSLESLVFLGPCQSYMMELF